MKTTVKYFTKLVELSPEEALSHFSLASAYEQQGDLEDAAAAFERAVSKDVNFSPAYARLFDIYAGQRDWKSALDVSKRFYKTHPYDYRSSFQLASVYFQMKEQDRALDKAEESVRLEEDNASIHVLLARILAAAGEYTRATAEVKKALLLDSNNLEAHEMLKNLEAVERSPDRPE